MSATPVAPPPRPTLSAASLLVLALLLAAPALALWRLAPPRLLPWIAGWLALGSLVTFAVYAWDKRRAVRAQTRTPEKSLHLLALLGGWPGAFLAQRLLRHKNAKRPFQFVFWLIVMLYQYAAIDSLLDWRLALGLFSSSTATPPP